MNDDEQSLTLLETKLLQEKQWNHIIFWGIGVILLFVLLNVLYINYSLYTSHAATTKLDTPQNIIQTQTITKPIVTSTQVQPPSITPQQTLIHGILLPTPFITLTPMPTPRGNQQNVMKEYYIPLGAGSSQAGDWADVPGVVTQIDFGQYQDIKQILFEASIYIPTTPQTVFVRLFNVTDQHTVWNSPVTSTGTTSYVISNPIIYESGLKTYQVQMKTQLQAPANLVSSRIHISVN